ncbi:MAG: SDR family NAD(P)-dependent oxidoreductase [Pseudomonadota bacterium]|nr:SDR family NAD(P)-dependent oxidoreductase [Pseudomonadota bacterium]
MPDHPADARPLKDRIILVTGAGRGIGAAVSRQLARSGATVVLSGPRVSELEVVYDDILAAGGPTPAIAPINLESLHWDEAQTLVDTMGDEFGRLDGVLHNAAHLHGLTPLANFPLAEWYKTLQINLNAPFVLTMCCLPVLRQSSDASIVFTSDQVGLQAKAYYGAYGVSKFALQGLMQTLAEETRDNTNIRVNSIDPGPVDTELYRRIFPEPDLNGLAQPSDIALPYVYLLGPASRGITGQHFRAQEDGPWQSQAGDELKAP